MYNYTSTPNVQTCILYIKPILAILKHLFYLHWECFRNPDHFTVFWVKYVAFKSGSIINLVIWVYLTPHFSFDLSTFVCHDYYASNDEREEIYADYDPKIS